MKFIADIMVGKLARYLRMAGQDVEYLNDADDSKIIKIAIQFNRIVLTRDSLMLKRKEFNNGTLKFIHIKSDRLILQLRQVKSEMGLPLEPVLSICLLCNHRLEPASDIGDIEKKVPPYVFKTQKNFSICPNCGKYFWQGTHYQHIRKFFSSI